MNPEPASQPGTEDGVAPAGIDEATVRTLAGVLGFRVEDDESAEVGRALATYLSYGESLQPSTASDVLPTDDPRWFRTDPA